MKNKIIMYLKTHPRILKVGWILARFFLSFIGFFVPVNSKRIAFSSFGGRKFDDSPRAIYETLLTREEFSEWDFVWFFTDTNTVNIPHGRIVKIDTLQYWFTLLSSRVWVSNSGMDRGVEIKKRNIIKIETWHGTPLKKICGDENQNSMTIQEKKTYPKDSETIRCAQSEYDRDIFSRLFHAEKECFLLCDLPRNDSLLRYTARDIDNIKETLKIPKNKKVILYTPTYREYMVDDNKETFMLLPVHWEKWKNKIGKDYVVLIRTHYAIVKALKIQSDEFLKNVSDYPYLNDLYVISDLMISDYSSTFFDYSILERPMLCFAYDQDEYEEKRGLYLNLETDLPCNIDHNEDELLEHILHLDYSIASENTKAFHQRFSPYAGDASNVVIESLIQKLALNK